MTLMAVLDTGTSPAGGQWCPDPRLKFVPPISCFDLRLLDTSNIALKNVPPCGFWSLLLRNPGDGPDLTVPMSVLQQSGHFRAFNG